MRDVQRKGPGGTFGKGNDTESADVLGLPAVAVKSRTGVEAQSGVSGNGDGGRPPSQRSYQHDGRYAAAPIAAKPDDARSSRPSGSNVVKSGPGNDPDDPDDSDDEDSDDYDEEGYDGEEGGEEEIGELKDP